MARWSVQGREWKEANHGENELLMSKWNCKAFGGVVWSCIESQTFLYYTGIHWRLIFTILKSDVAQSNGILGGALCMNPHINTCTFPDALPALQRCLIEKVYAIGWWTVPNNA